MNVVVAHDGRQHVGQLLIALEQQGWLRRFYAGFASNTLPRWLSNYPRLRPVLRKRTFDQISARTIRSFYLSALLTRLSTNGHWQIGVAFGLFARWVAWHLRQYPHFDLLIGYENTNLASFRAARKLGSVTVLDLTQVHHNRIDELRQLFPVDTLSKAQNQYINGRKQRALELTDYVLTLSSLATLSLTQAGMVRNRIYEVNLGVDTVQFCPALKPTDGRFRLLFVGTITRRKGVDQLLTAFHDLQLPQAELLLVGPVGDAEALLKPCPEGVCHLPFLHHEELVRHYQRADVFVFPSYLDAWGQVVLEAMACGTPVIVSDHTGAKDAVAKGGGFIVPTGDVGALKDCIRYLYTHREQTTQLGRTARHVAEHYTWAQYYRQVTEALTDIAHRERIPL